MSYPLKPLFSWPDRRPIAALHLCERDFVCTINPAGWNTDMSKGIAAGVLTYADRAIAVMKEINAQGCIVWDAEGGQYPRYVGDPEFAYGSQGEHLGKFFARFRSAGFKVGICIRPSEFDWDTHVQSESKDPFETLRRKAAFARIEWKCRLFYIDSNVSLRTNALLPATIFARLHKALPDCLFLPEITYNAVYTPQGNIGVDDRSYWLHTAPYMELRQGKLGPPAEVLADIPDAFSVVNVSAAEKMGGIKGNYEALKAAKARGDVLMVNGWWDNPDEIPDVQTLLGA